jgi:hypothetical protein
MAGSTDIIIYLPERDYIQSINDVLANFNQFFKANKLTLNFEKTRLHC